MHFKMSSAICFNLDQFEILWSGNELTKVRMNFDVIMTVICLDLLKFYLIYNHLPFFHTVPLFDNPEKEAF